MRAAAVCALLVASGSAVTSGQAPSLTNSIGMELVLIRPGTFVVGRFQPVCPSPSEAESVDQDPRARWTPADYKLCERMVKRDSRPGFTATIARAYYIGKYEVTQREWTDVMGTNPSVFQGRRVVDDATRHPVDSVTWEDAQRFIVKLNQMEQTTGYRLPTEFEWEYAARAGARADPSWDEIRELAWEQDIEHASTHLVGTKKPNAWGLYDMLGNVWEWVGGLLQREDLCRSRASWPREGACAQRRRVPGRCQEHGLLHARRWTG